MVYYYDKLQADGLLAKPWISWEFGCTTTVRNVVSRIYPPPTHTHTSGTVRGPIKRSLYVTITMTQLYQESAHSLDPRNHRYQPRDDLLWPMTFEKELFSMYTLCCTCKTCNTIRCSCRKASVQCSNSVNARLLTVLPAKTLFVHNFLYGSVITLLIAISLFRVFNAK